MTEIATIDWFGRWGTSVFSENTAIFYSNVPGHMTKMASRPIYGKKTSKISFFGTKRQMTLKFGIQHRVFSTSKFVQMMTLG